MTNTIYIVQGNSGAYEAYKEWMVCAYTNKQDAEIHCEDASVMNRYIKEKYRGKELPDKCNPVDPDYPHHDDDVNYSIVETRLRDYRNYGSMVEIMKNLSI